MSGRAPRLPGALRRIIAVCLLGLAATPASASAFDVGFNDFGLQYYAGSFGAKPNEASLLAGLAHARAAGATTFRTKVLWRDVAPGASAPVPDAAGADPAWPGYDWAAIDMLVRDVRASGMEPLLWFEGAPSWAEGARRPAVSTLAPAGSWKPSAAKFRRFAEAVATRYDGRYPDPQRPGQTLPRVALYQGWNEPNLYASLSPQWERRGGRWKNWSIAGYRALQNAAYRGIKAGNRTAKVLTAATAPFGGFEPADQRIQPVRFWRELLCVTDRNGRLTAKRTCPKLRFDGWAHNIYPNGSPMQPARNADDVVVADMRKLTKLMSAVRRVGRVKRSAASNLWITEISWDSYPDPRALSLEMQAQYLQGALYLLARAGVRHVLWWNIRDAKMGSNYASTLQSGVYMLGSDPNNPTLDIAKPSLTAYRFPFTAFRSGGVARLWALAPGSGTVEVQVQRSGQWQRLVRLRRGSGRVVSARLRLGKGEVLRAVQGDAVSLTWTTF